MSDEIDFETARLNRLFNQKIRRITAILAENIDLVGKDKNVQTIPAVIFDKKAKKFIAGFDK